jgi:predicted HAD superfamily Cof-like phosphohydrolase
VRLRMNNEVPTIELVEEFHFKFRGPIAMNPIVPSFEIRKLRLALIIEEAKEYAEASGFFDEASFALWTELQADLNKYKFIGECTEINMVEAADALADIDYVTAGANLAWGFPAFEIIKHVHESNMSKLGENGQPIMREDGKIIKGPNYFKPDIRAILAKYVNDKEGLDKVVESQSPLSHNTAQPHTDSSR